MGVEPDPGPPQALAKELVGGGTESRGSLRREVREKLAARTGRGKSKSGAAEGRRRRVEGVLPLRSQVRPAVRSWCGRGQTHRSCSRRRGLYLPWLTLLRGH